MNDLRTVGADNGNAVLYFPIAGHEFYFEKVDWQTVTIKRVFPVDSVEQVWDKTTDYEDLPTAVRKVLKKNNLRYRSTAASAEEAMV